MNCRLTVAVLTRNRFASLQRCIDAVRKILGPYDEILVVDNGSTDATPEWLAKMTSEQLRWICAPRSVAGSYASLRNLAITQARGEALLFTDDDCVPANDWISRAIKHLAHADAVGGAVIPARPYDWPWWWSPQLLWTIGMSAPGLFTGDENAYPATANMGAPIDVWRARPFAETKARFEATTTYLAGREDAQWWAEARRDGLNVVVDPEMVVHHNVPDDRLAFSAVLSRARADGTAAWQRDPRPDALPHILNEAWAARVSPFFHPFRTLSDPGSAMAEFLWASRQKAWSKAAQSDLRHFFPQRIFSNFRAAGAAIKGGIRDSAGRLMDAAVLTLRPAYKLPKAPGRILVAGPTYLGDTLILQPILRLFRANYPDTEIAVWTCYPELLRDVLPDLQIIEDGPDAGKQVVKFVSDPRGCDAVFAPYYHFGDEALWRSELAGIGHVFDREHGFKRRRDIRLAARCIVKNLAQNELLNLRKLFSPWPLEGEISKPILAPLAHLPDGFVEAIQPPEGMKLVLLQIGSGNSIKNIPEEMVVEFVRRLLKQPNIILSLIGDESQSAFADEICSKFNASETFDRVTNACGNESVWHLAGRIRAASLLICPCSGPKHMAMAMDVPTFTLYGPTSPEQWGGIGDPALHAHVRSPRHRLTPAELVGLPPSFVMDGFDTEVVWQSLLRHMSSLSLIGGSEGNTFIPNPPSAHHP
ncbi:hypothetical protein CVU37_08765 [candidate division BRC1 bacterium HGW-BRC1-1]|nr:MAG: hypothetical protein CVU37_08765 [candidate division BRC1 bacterium HGW-BRC1-1]